MISYQPDWLTKVEVTRTGEDGTPVTKGVFQNPGYRQENPSNIVTHIVPGDGDAGFGIELTDPNGVVKQITVKTVVPGDAGTEDTTVYTIQDETPDPPPGD